MVDLKDLEDVSQGLAILGDALGLEQGPDGSPVIEPFSFSAAPQLNHSPLPPSPPLPLGQIVMVEDVSQGLAILGDALGLEQGPDGMPKVKAMSQDWPFRD